jgi:hypothetical protein
MPHIVLTFPYKNCIFLPWSQGVHPAAGLYLQSFAKGGEPMKNLIELTKALAALVSEIRKAITAWQHRNRR